MKQKSLLCVLADRIDSLQKLIVTEFFSAFLLTAARTTCRDDIALQQVLYKIQEEADKRNTPSQKDPLSNPIRHFLEKALYRNSLAVLERA